MPRRLLFCLLAAAAAAQVPIPDTPAGAVFSAWLSAINSGDKTKMQAFQEAYAPDRPDLADRSMSMYRQSGGFDLLALDSSDPGRVSGQMREKNGGRTAAFSMDVSAGNPPRLARMALGPGAASPPMPAISESLNPLQALDEAAQRTEFSGAMLVARNGEVVFEKAYGMADRERGAPNALNSQFRIGSMNKMFTAVAILQLVGEGKIELNAPLKTYLPDYPNAELASQVTIRHLLTHTGGTGDIFTKEYEKARLDVREPKDFIKLFGGRGVAFKPGTQWEYSNYGFILLGNVVEAVSGMSYFDYVRTNVFDPAEMRDTDSLPETESVARRTMGYTRQSGALRPNTDTLPWRGTPAGGGYSTVGDLLKFAQALQSGKLLPKRWLDEATKVQTSSGPGYGYGFSALGDGPKAYFGHNGGAPGMNGELRIYPRLGYVVAAISNLDPPAASQLVDFFEGRMEK